MTNWTHGVKSKGRRGPGLGTGQGARASPGAGGKQRTGPLWGCLRQPRGHVHQRGPGRESGDAGETGWAQAAPRPEGTRRERRRGTAATRTCVAVQKMWASSCWKRRTRVKPLKVADGSFL